MQRWSMDIGAKKIWLKGKLETFISVSDLFNTSGLHQKIKGENFEADYKNYYETQIFTVGLKVKL